ncbi:hypothetical protein MMC08_005606 [Hypocenomyce scalaris]|nr:hypothetical protein [Hypocenomyce scalaris]
MSQPEISGALSNVGESLGSMAEGSQRGARRRKLAGYLKAANELRQTYQQSYTSRSQNDAESDENDLGIPGAFPEVAIVRNGEEEMVLFPSYARRHVKQEKGQQQDPPGSSQGLQSSAGGGDAEYWRREWDRYEDDNAVVDVDVRGWIYSPHRGPMTRKNRLLIGLARHLSGIPAPSASSRGGSPVSSPRNHHRDRVEARAARHEEEQVEKVAEAITKQGEGEADIARRGGYSEYPGRDSDRASIYSAASEGRSPSPEKDREQLQGPTSSLQHEQDNAPGPGFLAKRASWNQPADMTPAELSIANANMMTRLKPFLTDPLVSIPLTVFFYNDKASRSRTITTNEAGHFSLRAGLDFVPTNVRVLASENLSAVKEVQVTEPGGVSMISDIDDTIKHSAISSGAREIFRNTFIRELEDLAIEGVKEWYTKMAEIGVSLHYVSNSPWQLYPVLVSFFARAGLPPGSFHLKQYSGMLQGIFEPVAERKKSTLERIMRDFPQRQFILVGDSGEADLELYTDIVVSNPGRILGVFIRDVTTSQNHGFFDSSIGALKGERGSKSPQRGRKGGSISPTELAAKLEQRPALPPRQQTQPAPSQEGRTGPVMGTLIDFDEEPEKPRQGLTRSMTDTVTPEADRKASVASTKSLPPSRPSKPIALRSLSGELNGSAGPPNGSANTTAPRRRPVPPPKPRKYSNSQDSNNHPTDPSPLSQTQNISPPGSRATSLERSSYRTAVKNKVASAYNALPSWYGSAAAQPSNNNQLLPGNNDSSRTISTKTTAPSNPIPKSLPPPIPPRRNLTSYPAAAAQYATNRISSTWNGGTSNNARSGDDISDPSPPVNKKEELWKRRWVRARDVLEDKGVLLRSWRVGGDVEGVAVALVERAGREEGKEKLPRWRSRDAYSR